jgi:hypothetical protein
MLQAPQIAIRTECPPGACTCEREKLLDDPQADMRVLRLTREEEKRLLQRIEAIASYGELKRLQGRIWEQLGVTLTIEPGSNEVRTVRGLAIVLSDRTGLCKKVRQSVPAAVRRCLEQHPDIVYAILDAHDLLGMG